MNNNTRMGFQGQGFQGRGFQGQAQGQVVQPYQTHTGISMSMGYQPQGTHQIEQPLDMYGKPIRRMSKTEKVIYLKNYCENFLGVQLGDTVDDISNRVDIPPNLIKHMCFHRGIIHLQQEMLVDTPELAGEAIFYYLCRDCGKLYYAL